MTWPLGEEATGPFVSRSKSFFGCLKSEVSSEALSFKAVYSMVSWTPELHLCALKADTWQLDETHRIVNFPESAPLIARC
jgi:hypothetical protein